MMLNPYILHKFLQVDQVRMGIGSLQVDQVDQVGMGIGSLQVDQVRMGGCKKRGSAGRSGGNGQL